MTVSFTPLPGIPEIEKRDDLGKIFYKAIHDAKIKVKDKDVLIVAHKVISKSEGQLIHLKNITPSENAITLAKKVNKDPRKVEVILRESDRVIKSAWLRGMPEGILICRHRLGFVSANAGIDESNLTEEGTLLLLPKDPDQSAARLRQSLKERLHIDLAVIITDSFGRPWRMGIINVAIGIAGFPALLDPRGKKDSRGYPLRATTLAVADEMAAASGLVMGKLERNPAVLAQGYDRDAENGKGINLIRPEKEDLFL